MNLAELIGELDSAVSEAKEAGDRVRKAIEGLKSIFGSIGVSALSAGITVIEPTMPLENESDFPCPYCGKKSPPYHRPHRDSPRWPADQRMRLHVAQMRRQGHTDHGALSTPIYPVAP